MCFYDQLKFSCGDYRWGDFRVHCNKEHLTGETCGIKLVMSTLPIEGNCWHCEKFEIKKRRRAQELDRVNCWKKDPGRYSASIERSEETVQLLECEMRILMDKRGTRLQSTKPPSDELAAPSERRDSFVREWLNGSAPQYISPFSDGQKMLSAVDDGVSISSGASGGPTESTAMTTQPGSEAGQMNLVPSSSQAPSCTSEIGSEQPVQPDDLSSAQPKSPMSLMNDETTSPSDPNCIPQQLCGVSATSPFKEGQKAVSESSPWANLSSMAVTAFEHVTSRVFDTLDMRSVKNWMITMGLPVLRLCEPPMEEGMSRVRWKCRCGRQMYDDYIEKRPGAAADLAGWLNDNVTTRPSADQSRPGDQSTTTATSGSSGLIHLTQQSTNVGPQSWRPPFSYNPCPHRREEGSPTIECDPECRWLLVCARSKKRPPILSQLNVCSTDSDVQLYNELKDSYSKLKGKWMQLFSLRGVKSIRFVQFELHPKDLVDILKVPSMPPPTRQNEYIYQSGDLIPPLGSTLMTHLFHHPEDASEYKSITCLRVPKKRKAKLTVCPQQGTSVGWGIHIVEGWVGSTIWLLALILFLSGTLVFGVCWAVLERDLQGAFGAAAYLVALAGLGVGTGQAFFG